MSIFWTITLIGLMIYYMLAQAFKVEFFTLEILIHNIAHFFSGFITFGLLVFFQAKHKGKVLSVIAIIVIVVGLIIANERNVDSDATDLTMVVYNSYLFFWGALTGFILARGARLKIDNRITSNGKTQHSEKS